MKKKLFLLLTIAPVVLMVEASDYNNAFATVRCHGNYARTYAFADAKVKDGPYDWEEDQGGPLYNAEAEAYSQHIEGSDTSWVDTYAKQWWYGKFRLRVKGHVYDWGYGKSGDSKEFEGPITLEDDIACSTFVIGVQDTAVIWTYGNIMLFPRQASSGNWTNFELTVTDDSQSTCFWGKISLDPTGLVTVGDYQGLKGITDNSSGDTFLFTVDRYDTVSFAGPADSLKLDGVMHCRSVSVPTTTQWGLFVLGALMVASAVHVMLRRKKAGVLA